MIDLVDWKCEIVKDCSDINLGCRRCVSAGIDWVISQEEEEIILEDDCVPDASFLQSCEELPEKYRHDERVMHKQARAIGHSGR